MPRWPASGQMVRCASGIVLAANSWVASGTRSSCSPCHKCTGIGRGPVRARVRRRGDRPRRIPRALAGAPAGCTRPTLGLRRFPHPSAAPESTLRESGAQTRTRTRPRRVPCRGTSKRRRANSPPNALQHAMRAGGGQVLPAPSLSVRFAVCRSCPVRADASRRSSFGRRSLSTRCCRLRGTCRCCRWRC